MGNDLTLDNQQKRFCPYCGQAVLPQAAFCHNCGSNLSVSADNATTNPDMSQNPVVATDATNASAPAKKNSRGLSILGGVCALLSIIAFLIALLQKFQFDPDRSKTYKTAYIEHDLTSSNIWTIGVLVGCALLIFAVFFCIYSIAKERINVLNVPACVLGIIAVVMMLLLLPQYEKRMEHYDMVQLYSRTTVKSNNTRKTNKNTYESETDERIKRHNDAIRDVTAAIDRDLGGR